MDNDYGFYDSIDDESLDEKDYTTDEHEEDDELDFIDDMDDDDESDSDLDDTDEESLDEQDSTIDEYEEDDELDFLDDMEDDEDSYLDDTDEESLDEQDYTTDEYEEDDNLDFLDDMEDDEESGSDSYWDDTDDESDLEDVVDDTKVVSGHINEMQTEHLQFKGIPICGNVYSFANSLRKKGYSFEDRWDSPSNEDTLLMRGKFAGCADCSVSLSYTKKTHTIYEVGILGKSFYSPTALIDEYLAVCYAFASKYGECYKEVKNSAIEHLNSFQEIDMETLFAFQHSASSLMSSIVIVTTVIESKDCGYVYIQFTDGEGECLYEKEKNLEKYKKSSSKQRRYIDLDDI